MRCQYTSLVNVTANDSDPDGDTPLLLQTVTKASGGSAQAIVYNSSTIQVTGDDSTGLTTFNYTILDSRGASGTGTLAVNTTYWQTCDPGFDDPF